MREQRPYLVMLVGCKFLVVTRNFLTRVSANDFCSLGAA
jgi:hypothetical protein